MDDCALVAIQRLVGNIPPNEVKKKVMKYLLMVSVLLVGCAEIIGIETLETKPEPEATCENVCQNMVDVGCSEAVRGYDRCVEDCQFRDDIKDVAPVEEQRECVLEAETPEECADCNYWGE